MKLSEALRGPRRMVLPSGVVLHLKQTGFHERTKATMQMTPELLEATRALEASQDALKTGGDAAYQAWADAIAMVETVKLDRDAIMHIAGWENVTGDDDEPLPFSLENWRLFRDCAPDDAAFFRDGLSDPARAVAEAGNASAALQSGDGEAVNEPANTASS